MTVISPLTAAWIKKREAIKASRTRLGGEGYAHLCAILRDNQSTVRGFGIISGLGRTAAYRFLLSMHQLGWVYIASWELHPRIRPLPVFAFGHGHEDAPAPTVAFSGRKSQSASLPKQRLCPGVIAFVHILRALDLGPCNRGELCEATGLDGWTIQNALSALVPLGLAHIAAWDERPQGGAPIASYDFGPGNNARKPQKNKRRSKQDVWRSKVEHIAMLQATAGALPVSNEELEAA